MQRDVLQENLNYFYTKIKQENGIAKNHISNQIQENNRLLKEIQIITKENKDLETYEKPEVIIQRKNKKIQNLLEKSE